MIANINVYIIIYNVYNIIESDVDIQLLAISEVFDLSYPELESYLTKIYDILNNDISSSSNIQSKSSILSYITISSSESPKFANIISSSAIVGLLVELLQESPSQFQLQVAYSLGIIFKNSTFISPKVGEKSRIFEVFEQMLLTSYILFFFSSFFFFFLFLFISILSSLLSFVSLFFFHSFSLFFFFYLFIVYFNSETSVQLKRKIFICLGELLYYTITAVYISIIIIYYYVYIVC